jgi:hypothetical protein
VNEHLREWMRSAHTSREWLAATADLRYPDLVPQLVTAFADERSGDLVLFASAGWDLLGRALRRRPRRRSSPRRCTCRCGSPVRASVPERWSRPRGSSTSLPTLLDLVGVTPPASPPLDGVSFAAELR